uniref:Uncharacterized protein n=1 Tax=Anguilla anguilla TaxID=7936 RepID=A0A0E9V9U4_ANGAN
MPLYAELYGCGGLVQFTITEDMLTTEGFLFFLVKYNTCKIWKYIKIWNILFLKTAMVLPSTLAVTEHR